MSEPILKPKQIVISTPSNILPWKSQLLDNVLHLFTTNTTYKFYLLSFFHYAIAIGFVLYAMFVSQSQFIVISALLMQLFVVGLNLWDGYCFMMKLERHYVGKHWFGPYSIITAVFPTFANRNSINSVFFAASAFSLYYLGNKAYEMKLNKKHI